MELSGCCPDLLNSVKEIESILLGAAVDGGATVISSHFHPFSPQGLSGVIVIAESHITIHTWPEHGYAAVDVFTCGSAKIADAVAQLIADRFNASVVKTKTLTRTPAETILHPPVINLIEEPVHA